MCILATIASTTEPPDQWTCYDAATLEKTPNRLLVIKQTWFSLVLDPRTSPDKFARLVLPVCGDQNQVSVTGTDTKVQFRYWYWSNVSRHFFSETINQFKLVQQSRQQMLRAYCPSLYTVGMWVKNRERGTQQWHSKYKGKQILCNRILMSLKLA